MTKVLIPLLAASLSAAAVAQVSSPPPRTTTTPPATRPMSNVQPAAAPDMGASLYQLNQVVENARVDLAKLRIDKWKTDSNEKRQLQANTDSLQRNMSAALPAIVEQVRANPASVAAAFKLYRNLNALYDVLAMVTESAGAFGSKEEYQALATDTSNLDNLRRSMADKVEAMATARDTEMAQLQMRARQAAAAATPAKKIVVDDTEPAKKPSRKTTKKKTTTASETPTPPK